ncbi:sulfite exporter TauE/SafE family protein [Larkinella terrae]|uniref:Sulfite exporter TauE/SafE family protein n=1 Tax=Larkinella terrae TaxID=2025311 RepID=A0A7K0ECC9_9BACT|nr:sulfite exporter TauE/SafE family protein [Larkinella terrae]MRS59660.1 sulfite exporter TauE/SafE family protein [Larkinella terrae]
MATAWTFSALMLGLVGSLHCVGMCGPLAMALPVGRLPVAQRWLGVGLYHLGRILAYAGLGMALGSLGQGLLFIGMQRPLSIAAGLFLIGWTVVIRGRFGGLAAPKAMHWLVGPLAAVLKTPSPGAFAVMGFLNGLLPCGSVYIALAGAVVMGNALGSAVYMLLFGIGTVPALLAIRLVPAFFSMRLRQRFVKMMPLLAVGLGIVLVIRGIYMTPLTSSSEPAIPLCHGVSAAGK